MTVFDLLQVLMSQLNPQKFLYVRGFYMTLSPTIGGQMSDVTLSVFNVSNKHMMH